METLELEQMKRPQLAKVAAEYKVAITPGMSNEALIAAIKAAAGYSPRQPDEKPQQPEGQQPPVEQQPVPVQYVMMRRTTDGDGPHPIHPDEVENYRRGEWVVVEEQQQQ